MVKELRVVEEEGGKAVAQHDGVDAQHNIGVAQHQIVAAQRHTVYPNL